MKLNSKTYSEVQRVARLPRLPLLMLGVICGAMVPTMYMRKYLLPRFRKEDLQEITEPVSAGNSIARPVMKLWPMLNAQQKKDVMLAQAPVRRIDAEDLDDEGNLLMFSSIM
ncbi:hypothetical protein HG536_0A01140 [Torulaspora globosa]|uniref:Uncharacterized protein n=1 Tax=Torulaspora globosa TaxID=48254 RepID=A0A7G3Z9W1_9SACH|nr:uncharacterized protein HG536_0A01140 [Torulaspora globosa]QLL30297.1 hypothetical protein HG536_0A01140 [Torulaspora globosa]